MNPSEIPESFIAEISTIADSKDVVDQLSIISPLLLMEFWTKQTKSKNEK